MKFGIKYQFHNLRLVHMFNWTLLEETQILSDLYQFALRLDMDMGAIRVAPHVS